MSVLTDFSLDTVNSIIKHTAGTTVFSANQLYSQIQDWMDDAAYMDFTPPMSAQTPTDYTVINGWYLDEGLTNQGAANNCIEWLQGGAITTSGYLNVIYRLTFGVTYTAAVAGDIGKTVQNTGVTNTGTLLAYDNTAKIWWIRKVLGTFVAEAVTIVTGTGAGTTTAVATGEMAWPNIYTLGSIDTTGALQQIYIVQNKLHVKIWGAAGTADPTPAASRHIDILIKTKSVGVNIDAGNLTLFLRNYPAAGTNTDLYDNFALTALTGRNAVPLATSADLNNTTATATISTFTDIKTVFVNGTITHGAVTGTFPALESVSQAVSGAAGVFISDSAGVMTLGNVTGTFNATNVITGGTSAATATSTGTLLLNNTTRVTGKAFTQDVNRNYSIIIDCATRVLTQVYEYLKYITRQTSAYQTYGLTTPDSVTAATVATINALDGEQYITAMVDTTTSANTFAAVKPSPFGTFAGGKFFGARGVWIQNMAAADVRNYQLIDSDGITRNPPNQQSLTITNLVVGAPGDAVGVFQSTGAASTAIKKNLYLMTTQATASATIVVGTAITADTPTTGYIRVVQASGAEQRYYFASWTGSTFTLGAKTDGYGTVLSTTTTQAYTVTVDTAYVPFLDDLYLATSASVTVIYSVDRNIVVNVRRYNAAVAAPNNSIIPFQTTGTFSSTGFSTPAIRTADTIVT